MENETALWYFEGVNLYKILCPQKVKAMKETHVFNVYQKNQFIIIPEASANFIYMVAKGRVKLGHHQEDGREVIKPILTTGEVFGALIPSGEIKAKDFAQSMDNETTIYPLEIEQLKALVVQDKELSFKILKLDGLRLTKIERKIELLVFKDARTRVIEFLKDKAAWKSKKVGFEMMIPSRLTNNDIASLTGSSRQTVTAILSDLQSLGLITFDRKQILIRDLDKLK